MARTPAVPPGAPPPPPPPPTPPRGNPDPPPGAPASAVERALGDPTFRDRVRHRVAEAFGPPQELRAESGPLYRWVLPREGGHDGGGERARVDSGVAAHVYLTIDSPEMPTLAHVLVSDPGSRAIEPITSTVIRTMPELDALLARVRARLAADA